ncbi:RIIB lysis inhibitor [Roseobacter phage RD-1410W1-01]|uniref:RIIB-like protein n=1 Tax=Roseobacter phage RD-1410W1-01 TaxID=1815984 RepID=A0A191VYI7_9CAUD|nr:RIIB lysis inhibitor [Roseobacter phage RD-1410W1-01]ANJ20782.1 rIIB-like protein [Roseobacter phage RD-1410W1-01]
MANVKNIVSMLVAETKITLISSAGEVLDMKLDGPYDTTAISEFLAPQLSGGNIVELNLDDYLTVTKALTPEYEEDGIVITQIIDGKEVQGIFYPQKISVSVQESPDVEPVVIPKVEKLQAQMKRAATEQSPAVRNFLSRLAPVVRDRLHSAEDLMDFIETAELPLTNDGMIVAYKRVRRGPDPGTFVDCHSQKIVQRLGSSVWMDVDGVDPSRNKSCSHGLHVANLGYMRSFGGDSTLIVLVDPADFIAVPHGETTKARVCRYLVVGVMGQGAHETVRSSHVEGDLSFEQMITDVVSGRHVQAVETVKVGKKEILEVLPIVENLEEALVPAEPVAPKAEVERSGRSLNTDPKEESKDIRKMAKTTKAAAQGRNLWDNAPAEVIAAFEDMRAGTMSKTAIATKHNTSTRTMGRWADKYDYEGYVASKAANMTVGERAMALYDQWINGVVELADLVSFKKARKKGWAALGFNGRQVTRIENAIKAS